MGFYFDRHAPDNYMLSEPCVFDTPSSHSLSLQQCQQATLYQTYKLPIANLAGNAVTLSQTLIVRQLLLE